MEKKKPPTLEQLQAIAEEVIEFLRPKGLRVKDIRFILRRVAELLEHITLKD